MVLNGGMGVDKFKEIGGVTHHFLRFICVFVPINSFMRRLRGGSDDLPYLGQMSLVLMEPGDIFMVDSEDMESCFNIFAMPPAWNGYF
eukprot:4011166-Pyramimonas_sp.AAC.1